MSWNQTQNQQGIKDRITDSGKSAPKNLVPELALKIAVLAGLLLAIALIIYLALSMIQAVGHESEGVFRHIKRLFRQAPYMFRSSRGFGAFVELILIACFTGWVIRRFMDRSKK